MFADVIAEILPDALAHNVRALRACCKPATRFCAPLKASAYGHGVAAVAPIVERAGVDMAAVAQIDEALELRQTGWTRPILLLSAVLGIDSATERRDRLETIVRHRLTLTLCDDQRLPEIAATVSLLNATLPVQVKIDTGMGRMGFVPQHAVTAIRSLSRYPAIRLTGVYSHFGSADLSDHAQADEQLAAFRNVLEVVRNSLPTDTVVHMANTAATIERPETHFDMVRPGIGLYGLLPCPRFAGVIELRPALRLVTHVMLVKELPAGHCVGYGCRFRTTRSTRMGLLPVGYHDGFLRKLADRAVVGTSAGDAPSIGMISMDQMAIDLTDLPSVGTGARVVLMDERPERPNSVAALARLMDTSCYEVICLIGPRVARTVVPGDG